MSSEQGALVAAVGGALALLMVALIICALLWRRTGRLAARIDELEADRRTPRATATLEESAAYVITGVHPNDPETATDHDGVLTGRIDGALFADIVARESVIKAAGLAHGLRRALSPEARHRVRFAIKREVKRSRKQRRADVKAALRDAQSRERATTAEEDAA